jgi:hypothetical protein
MGRLMGIILSIIEWLGAPKAAGRARSLHNIIINNHALIRQERDHNSEACNKQGLIAAHDHLSQ